jgi:hypothetical protein
VFVALSIQSEAARQTVYDDLFNRHRSLIAMRARGESAAATGLVVVQTHAVGTGENQMFEVRESYDGEAVMGVLKTLKQSAEDSGQWREKVIVEWDGDPKHLSDWQLDRMLDF